MPSSEILPPTYLSISKAHLKFLIKNKDNHCSFPDFLEMCGLEEKRYFKIHITNESKYFLSKITHGF